MLQHRQQEIRYGFRGNSCIRDACSLAAVFMNRGDTGRDLPEGCFLQGWNPWMKGSGMIADLLNGGGKQTSFPARPFWIVTGLSMREGFLPLDADKSVFDGPEISEEEVLCEASYGEAACLFDFPERHGCGWL